MNLESNQSIHNLYQTAAKSISAANDMHGFAHDANETLIRGAHLAAAAQNAGLNRDQFLNVAQKRQDFGEVPMQDRNREMRQMEQMNKTNRADMGIMKEISRRNMGR